MFKEWGPRKTRILLRNFRQLSKVRMRFTFPVRLCQHQDNQCGSNKIEGRKSAAVLAVSPSLRSLGLWQNSRRKWNTSAGWQDGVSARRLKGHSQDWEAHLHWDVGPRLAQPTRHIFPGKHPSPGVQSALGHTQRGPSLHQIWANGPWFQEEARKLALT